MDYFKSIQTHMDFDGQNKAEKWSRFIITLFGAIGLIVGYVFQQFSLAVYILGAGVFLTTLLTVPPWPIYRKKPLKWQKPRGENSETNSKKGKKK